VIKCSWDVETWYYVWRMEEQSPTLLFMFTYDVC
jgi:hypothetical protein